MEVILKKSVEGLGVPGDVLKVANGYARNYLLPMQLAVHATERNRRYLEHQKRVIDHQESKDKEQAQEIAAQITGVTCTLKGELAKTTDSSVLLPLWMSQRRYGLKALS
jgi:large subunit ribosomal protein L9